jgi:hypothetical protein
MLRDALKHVDEVLEVLDSALLSRGFPRLANNVELANMSSMVGNLLASGIVKASQQRFERAPPHKYQDLRPTMKGKKSGAHAFEIKMAIDSNTPKGHEAKTGWYLTCRYVLEEMLGARNGRIADLEQRRMDRKDDPAEHSYRVRIWELRVGYLYKGKHFNKQSNTPRDAGKTATLNQTGMRKLNLIFLDPTWQPETLRGETSRYSRSYGFPEQRTPPARKRS